LRYINLLIIIIIIIAYSVYDFNSCKTKINGGFPCKRPIVWYAHASSHMTYTAFTPDQHNARHCNVELCGVSHVVNVC